MRFLIRWIVNSSGFLTAMALLPGIQPTSKEPWNVIAIVLVAGLFNALLGPILKLVAFPFIFLTFGLGLLLINMGLFWFVGYLGRELGFGFTVSGASDIILGALIVSTVNAVFGFLLSARR